ncbi:integrase family protein, partial [mine drainage metagenome]
LGHSLRGEPFLEKNYVRKVFREYVRAAKLDEVYDQSEESYGRTPRRLHRLTTHSLRHYAITSFARQSNGNVVLSSRFARHSDPRHHHDLHKHTQGRALQGRGRSLLRRAGFWPESEAYQAVLVV